MEKEIIYNIDLHFEHENWQRELDFWEDELKSFHLRLEELVKRWTDHKVLAEIEKFQNQFMIQQKEFDALKDQIEMHEKNMASHYEKNEDVLNKMFVSQHLSFREVMETERNLYDKLKKDFFRFMTKYM
ncbi:hypothetical protein QWY87_05115 [Lutimonas halocynthiae]|uniref:hypothetical protein n=1 Tax=Lutimonas halocynthiae TaxID=1446477 RepID=UPI0025B588BB|nr:hypothetical protein [Lutimonas halocynthiae]MDN3642069.1 hypothetical protein [Lutimonas halocynthiae]